MTMNDYSVLDEALLVKHGDIGGIDYLQAWHGGCTVNVYAVEVEGLDEVDVWTMFDEDGKPPDRDAIHAQMELWFNNAKARFEGGQVDG